ncbi:MULTISPECIES: SLATT domain-containing protein [unclassified Streptomyces]|uniref:SLATT domain-containing protein n=1 Tax=Streptomyces TaxID=1883 RepID=UPI0013DC588B|nr:SLATT domain-containing protein [Streptomyces sp. OM5714]
MRRRTGAGQQADGQQKFTGMRPMEPPPADSDALGVTTHYLSHFRKEYTRTRELMKKKARRSTVGIAALNGLIAVLGVAVAAWRDYAAWLGLASTAVAGVVGVISAWSGLMRHHELWQQRSLILAELQRIIRNVERREASGDDRQLIAREAMELLDATLSQDASNWGSLSRTPLTAAVPYQPLQAPAERSQE